MEHLAFTWLTFLITVDFLCWGQGVIGAKINIWWFDFY